MTNQKGKGSSKGRSRSLRPFDCAQGDRTTRKAKARSRFPFENDRKKSKSKDNGGY
jgi:hypothetical protein